MTQATFRAEFEAATNVLQWRVALRTWPKWNEKAAFEVMYTAGGDVYLGLIMAADPGKGHGAAAIRWLCALADKHGVRLAGKVDRQGTRGLSQSQLRAWYKRHGFTVRQNGVITRA